LIYATFTNTLNVPVPTGLFTKLLPYLLLILFSLSFIISIIILYKIK